MPADDVSDLRDVVDAINKLCDTMKTSYDGTDDGSDDGPLESTEVTVVESWAEPAAVVPEPPAIDPEPSAMELEAFDTRSVYFDPEPAAYDPEPVLPEPTTFDLEPTVFDTKPAPVELTAFDAEPAVFDSEPVPAEPMSEMYYTASSEVSLLSDTDMQDRAQGEDSDRERDDRNSVMAGHVAAMRERFESMTRTNTPCPDLMRSTSPSFEVFRNISSSPDIEKP
ncbi:uncharacterized protein LOC125068022 [Vanessa atalanta]|uniref:uncharacterized protein LOC125068022 n=1 Tax=Vanessa atalanta TaxID=42275 RepID=UPI001FCD2FEC|nr:uncharacterized protein LOC125068022 [Vanessa atalanta]